jgi:DNA processing protein
MVMPIDRALAWATLADKHLSAPALAALLREFSDPAELLAAPRARLTHLVPEDTVRRLATPSDPARVERTRAWLAEPSHEVIAWDDADYPRALFDIGDAPAALFFIGQRPLLNHPALAIVGSRHATSGGMDNARAFARALSDAGLTIVSGLALGIDGAAHEGGLAGASSTLAVCATGLDRVYPARHRALAHDIAARGAMLSEYPPGTPPAKEHFPRRNRLISGLARGVLVVEATLSSGSLITARCAGEQGRDVFAIPGSIHSPFSRGCHKLIREGAKLVETAQDVLNELGIAHVVPTVTQATNESAVLEGDGKSVHHALGHDPCDVDTLVARTHLDAARVSAALVALDLAGRAVAVPGGRWQRR